MSAQDLQPIASRWSEGQVFALLAESLEDGEPLPGEIWERFLQDPDEAIRKVASAFQSRRQSLWQRPATEPSLRGVS